MNGIISISELQSAWRLNNWNKDRENGGNAKLKNIRANESERKNTEKIHAVKDNDDNDVDGAEQIQ